SGTEVFHITSAKSGSMAAIDDLQIHHNIFSLANRRRSSMNKSDFWPQSGSDQHIHDDLLPVD
ncbi:hypothetical protein, partial [Rahnella aceris]|uniref:hypothetical protein n=1 Tax=Rahnella sp. (strain Y9602) TaxID=2703885 RepID=UPI001C257E42